MLLKGQYNDFMMENERKNSPKSQNDDFATVGSAKPGKILFAETPNNNVMG